MIRVFFTDEDPVIAARNLCDIHVSNPDERVLQILQDRKQYADDAVSSWAWKSLSNWVWLCMHTMAQDLERIYRGLSIETPSIYYAHEYERFAGDLWAWGRRPKIQDKNLTKFPSPIYQQIGLRPDETWRIFYFLENRADASWTRRKPPQWFVTC